MRLLGSVPLNTLSMLTLDNPYPILQRPETQSYFVRLLALKASGYSPPNYPSTYLTFDAADFVGTHHIFLLGDEIVGGFKNISLSRCDYYQITPPYRGLLKTDATQRHSTVFDLMLSQARQERREIVFSSGFTLREDLRGTFVAQHIKEWVAALMYSDSVACGNAPLIGAGVPRFKTEKLWDQIGYERMHDEMGILPPFPLLTSNSEPILLMKANTLSTWSRECFERHKAALGSRTILTSDDQKVRGAA